MVPVVCFLVKNGRFEPFDDLPPRQAPTTRDSHMNSVRGGCKGACIGPRAHQITPFVCLCRMCMDSTKFKPLNGNMQSIAMPSSNTYNVIGLVACVLMCQAKVVCL